MEQGGQLIRLTLDVKHPVELDDFVASFTSLAAEYDAYMKVKHPSLARDATMYVKDVRHGSIVADLITWTWDHKDAALALMSDYVTLEDFVEKLGDRIRAYTKPGGRADGATKTELKHFTEQVAAIANNPGSKMRVAALEVKRGEEEVRVYFEFDTAEAQNIQHRIAEHKAELDHTDRVDHERVLLRFTRTDTATVKPGDPTGERVIIEKLNPKPRRVVYASDIVEARFKHEIREEEDNIYKKAFLVDVNVEMLRGKAFAYNVTAVHEVFDLDEDD